MKPIDELTKKRFVPASFEGMPAIFVERPVIVHVKVSDVISEDWGVKCAITDLGSPGMHMLQRSPCPIAASWQVFSYSAGNWQAQYVPWSVFFDPQVIGECLACANEKRQAGGIIKYEDGQKIFMEHYRRVSEEFQRLANALLRPRGIRVN
jgi:hypothetical protein